MPTYDQLNKEKAYRDERMSPEMAEFAKKIANFLGIPMKNIGAKGDNSSGHMRGAHRSQRWILTSKYCTNRTYTVYPGLSDDLMDLLGGMDITPLNKQQMLLICRRLDAAVRAGLIEEVVAWYGNTDGDNRVDGYDNVKNAVASSDPSHLWHLHLTLNRWALRSKAMFTRLYAILTGAVIPESKPSTPKGGKDVIILASYVGDSSGSVYKGNGFVSEGIDNEDTVKDLIAMGANATHISSYFPGGGNKLYSSRAAMLKSIGQPRT